MPSAACSGAPATTTTKSPAAPARHSTGSSASHPDYRFAGALAILPQVLGLAPLNGTQAGRHADAGLKVRVASHTSGMFAAAVRPAELTHERRRKSDDLDVSHTGEPRAV